MGYTTNNMMIYMGLSENGRVYPNGEALYVSRHLALVHF